MLDEGDGDPCTSRTGGPPDAVQVHLLVLGAVVVHDVGDVVDVETARGDLGRDQHADLPVTEAVEVALACRLTEVAVDRDGLGAELTEVLDEAIRHVLRADEHVDVAAVRCLEDAREQPRLVHTVDLHEVLVDVRCGLALGEVGSRERRADHVAPTHADDRGRHRRAEQHRVPVGRARLDEPLDVGQEAHVEHLVGLVEHERTDVRQVEAATVEVVEESSRCADDDVHAGLQRLRLLLVGGAAVHGDGTDAECAADAEVLVDLDAQLAGGDDDEGLGAARRHVDALQEGEAEGERLAGAGAGLTDQVGPGEGHRQRHRLDGERMGDALGLERVAQGAVDSEVAEGVGHRFSLRSGVVRHGVRWILEVPATTVWLPAAPGSGAGGSRQEHVLRRTDERRGRYHPRLH